MSSLVLCTTQASRSGKFSTRQQELAQEHENTQPQRTQIYLNVLPIHKWMLHPRCRESLQGFGSLWTLSFSPSESPRSSLSRFHQAYTIFPEHPQDDWCFDGQLIASYDSTESKSYKLIFRLWRRLQIERRALKSLNPSKSLSNHTHLIKSSKNHSSKVGEEVSKCAGRFWLKVDEKHH
jgi:hypothetical protein